MKAARRKGAELLTDIREARDQSDQFHLWWLGQSGFLIQWQDQHLLIDPYLSDSLTHKYANTDKPHVRVTEQVIGPADLNFIDVVTSSHNHTDHLDAETLIPLMRVNEAMDVIVPAANQAFAAERLAVPEDRLTSIDANQSIEAGVFTIHALPAAHNTLDQDEQGRHKYLGYVFTFGDHALYHSGDTLLYDGLAARLLHYDLDVAILPINGNKPERRVAGNLSGLEAAELADQIAAGVVIPCHYDMFAFNTASPRLFKEECEGLGQRYAVLEQGERWSSDR
ncbi:MAG: L-ascorbate metabolism protein UlaG (beta-lactamase superfamily) [Kiritimatiellia bacterium]|jgi:L-ascorbate metabolism protein UlaG (beta-lactamase superfamily)